MGRATAVESHGGGCGSRLVLWATRGRRTSGCWFMLWLTALCSLFPHTSTQKTGRFSSGRRFSSSRKSTTARKSALTLRNKGAQAHLRTGKEERALTIVSNITVLLREPVGANLFPTVDDSTILFLHVFKCAGTSLRQVFMAWAAEKGWGGAIVQYCPQPQFKADMVCLNGQNDIADLERQQGLVSGARVFAGHLFWDFRLFVRPPYLLITTLRNPLEVYVSGQQFMHREDTRTLEEATDFVARKMENRMGSGQTQGISFIRRFVEQHPPYNRTCTPQSCDQIVAMTRDAVENLSTFFLVGVVEQMEGFLEVLKLSLDPELKYPAVWKAATEAKENGSPVRSRDVLESLDPELVSQFNASVLAYPWQVYNVALQLWDSRCREVLRPEDHDKLCSVPG